MNCGSLVNKKVYTKVCIYHIRCIFMHLFLRYALYVHRGHDSVYSQTLPLEKKTTDSFQEFFLMAGKDSCDSYLIPGP